MNLEDVLEVPSIETDVVDNVVSNAASSDVTMVVDMDSLKKRTTATTHKRRKKVPDVPKPVLNKVSIYAQIIIELFFRSILKRNI